MMLPGGRFITLNAFIRKDFKKLENLSKKLKKLKEKNSRLIPKKG